jgi:MFS family permease
LSKASNVGLSRAAQFALAATALAPVLLVWAASNYSVRWTESIVAVVIAVLLVAVCLGILKIAHDELQSEQLVVKKTSRLDKDALAFLITYALPVIVPSDKPASVVALVVFVMLVGLVLVQLHILHVNPLLGILGFHFFEVENDAGESALVVCRARQLPRDSVQGCRLGPSLWLVT